MKILVAEDDLMLADYLSEALLLDGHEVCGVAATVTEAVALARLHRPNVAILDMVMLGGERGSDIADQLAQSGDLGDTGVLYVSGDPSYVQQEARIGHACLSKPYKLSNLIEALEIVGEVALYGSTPRALPPGLQLLNCPSEALP